MFICFLSPTILENGNFGAIYTSSGNALFSIKCSRRDLPEEKVVG